MTILVCPLSKVASTLAARAPERIVSLLDPGCVFPQPGPAYAQRHLQLAFHDAHVASGGALVPSAAHVTRLLAFVAQWDRSAPILIHCRAGIGRSTATAFITACVHNPHVDPLEIAIALRRASPLARPNERLIELADVALGQGGRMTQAIGDTGRDLSWTDVEARLKESGEGEPFEMPSSFVA